MFSEIWRNSEITELWIKNTDGTPIPLQVADQQRNHLRITACAIPTAKHLLDWVRWVARAEWKRCGKFAHLRLSNQDSTSFITVKVTVHLRYLDFDSTTGSYTAKNLRSYTVDGKGNELRGAP